MSRYHIYRNPDGAGYLLDVQAELHSHLNTRIVIPVIPMGDAPKPAKTLNPLIQINGEQCSVVTQYLTAVQAKILKDLVLVVDNRSDEITAALDLLLIGF